MTALAAAMAWLGRLDWSRLLPIVVVILLVVGIGIARCQRDEAVADAFDARTDAKVDAGNVVVLERARKADDSAATSRAEDAARLAADAAALKESTDALPAQPASARRRARLECVRRQQAAAAAGTAVPACR